MEKLYLETTFILLVVDRKLEDSIKEELKDKYAFTSDVTLAEIHNLEEPIREFSARFLNDINIPVLKLHEYLAEFSRKYVYNKVLEEKDYSIGLHYLIASKNSAKLITADEKFEKLKEGLDRINSYFKVPITDVEIKGTYSNELLDKVRYNIGKLISSQGEKKFTVSIRESSEFFIREKKLPLLRREKI